MIRICPKCGDYYADDSLAFCRADGTPLVNVDPTSENWSEGNRVIQEQTKTLRKRARRLKWRRILTMSMSMTIITMVVSVVALNTREYLKPNPDIVSDTNSNSNSDNNPLGNDNQLNDNQRNDNQLNDNQRNDNQSNNNQGQDNPCSEGNQKDANGSILKAINQLWEWKSQSEQQLALSKVAAFSSGPRGAELGNPGETSNVGPRGPGKNGGRRDQGRIVAPQTKGDKGGPAHAEPFKVDHTTSFFPQCTEATVTFKSAWQVWRTDSPPPVKKVLISLVTVFRCTRERNGWSCRKLVKNALRLRGD